MRTVRVLDAHALPAVVDLVRAGSCEISYNVLHSTRHHQAPPYATCPFSAHARRQPAWMPTPEIAVCSEGAGSPDARAPSSRFLVLVLNPVCSLWAAHVR